MKSLHISIAALLLAGALAPMGGTAYACMTPQQEKQACAAKMGITLGRMQSCVARAQVVALVANGGCGPAGSSSLRVAACIAAAVTNLENSADKYTPNCGTHGYSESDYENLAVNVAGDIISTVQVLVTGSTCP